MEEKEQTRKQVYREKSLQRVSSPEQLDGYIKVVNTSTWIIIGAVIVLLIGALIWCSVVMLETETVTAAAVVKNEEIRLYVTADDVDYLEEGMTMHVADEDFYLPDTEYNAVKLYEQTDSEIISIIGSTDENYVYMTKFYGEIPNGVYSVSIATSEVSPFSLILN